MAEGILEPQESLKLNFNQTCVQSPLLHRLWACAVLCCLTGQCLAPVSQWPRDSCTIIRVVSKETPSCCVQTSSRCVLPLCSPSPCLFLGALHSGRQQQLWEV